MTKRLYEYSVYCLNIFLKWKKIIKVTINLRSDSLPKTCQTYTTPVKLT